ncbi:hypothetical protein [Planomonospora parontospora]|uniref:hypothetical protein n=1 Tax=Planomonospora parontospora TaxID=58119 RepID=UPI001670057B|nr:hypothetical protein [Planomonospora parontospora]GGL16756.1 hypothetical protein GCM10014719_18660 [Planomonospora parontospora subsp. antibiotica]GII15323.1 hypothetical protein Ppa05_20490 [Planomonospora parontospora subsp. antibiotica]
MRAALSAGALALALGGGIPVVAAASGSVARAADCPQGGGLLGGVTSGLCQTVDGVTDAVDGLTGSSLTPVTGGLDATAEKALEPVGELAPTERPRTGGGSSSGAPPHDPGGPGEKRDEGLLPEVLSDVCLPLVRSPGCAASVPDRAVRPTATPSPTGSRRPARPRKEAGAEEGIPFRPASPRPPETRTHTTEVRDPVLPEPFAVDAEAPRVDPLWPGPLTQELQQRMPGERAVTPTRSSDPLGTALTAALLAAAVIAVRLVHARRAEEESIPFEPFRVGRHRVA